MFSVYRPSNHSEMGRKATVRAAPHGGWNRGRAEHGGEHSQGPGARRGPREGPALAGGHRHLHASRLRPAATPRRLRRLLLPVPRLALRRLRAHPPRTRTRQPPSARLRVPRARPHPCRLSGASMKCSEIGIWFDVTHIFSSSLLLRVARWIDSGWIKVFCIPLTKNDDPIDPLKSELYLFYFLHIRYVKAVSK